MQYLTILDRVITALNCTNQKLLIAGIAWRYGVYVPFSPYCSNFMCPSMWKESDIFMCLLEFECAKRLKAHSQAIPADSLPIRARYGVYFVSSSLIYIVSYWSLQKPSWCQYFVITDCNVKTKPYQIIFYMFFLTLKWHRSLNFLSPLWITCPLWYYAMLCHCEDMECFETSLSKTIPALNGWIYSRTPL